MKNIIWLLLLSILACSPKNNRIEIRNEDGKVIERYTQNPKTEQREGKSELFTASGKLLETAIYKDGELQGERKLYHENGEIQVIEQYEDGIFKGKYQAFYDNKQLELEGEYVKGMMSGSWKRYYNSGELMEIVTFVANEENGPFIEYYKNGKTKTEGTYLDGDNEQGELKIYDEMGVLTKKMDCNKGVCRTSWTKEE